MCQLVLPRATPSNLVHVAGPNVITGDDDSGSGQHSAPEMTASLWFMLGAVGVSMIGMLFFRSRYLRLEV